MNIIMAKDMFGNTITHDLYGNPLKKENTRQPVGRTQKSSVRIAQKGRCKDCRKVLVVEEFHHVKHVANNGKSTTGNLVALCPECHRKRHIREAALKLDKKRLNKQPKTNNSFSLLPKKKSRGNYWTNPITGKKEKSPLDRGIW